MKRFLPELFETVDVDYTLVINSLLDKMPTSGALMHHGGRPLDLAQGVRPGNLSGPGEASPAVPSLHPQPPALGSTAG